LNRLGFATELFCEIDPAARAVLSKRFAPAKILHDVTFPNRIPSNADLVMMGFPCQDLSQVGTRKGISEHSS
jgi:DNA (cytosine-5)-methyltransferase 1